MGRRMPYVVCHKLITQGFMGTSSRFHHAIFFSLPSWNNHSYGSSYTQSSILISLHFSVRYMYVLVLLRLSLKLCCSKPSFFHLVSGTSFGFSLSPSLQSLTIFLTFVTVLLLQHYLFLPTIYEVFYHWNEW